MNLIIVQQIALDNALVAPEKRLKIEKCNMRIEFHKRQREPTYQVTLDALTLSPCYPAFLITAEVPEIYMHQFWNIIKKTKDTDAYQFKLDKQKFQIDTEVFHEILHICPRLPNQYFVEPSSDEEMVPFIKDLREATPKKARKLKKPASPSKKKTLVAVEEPTKKPAKKPKKAPAKVDRGKGMDLLSNVALLKVAQLKKVPDELQGKTIGTNEGIGTLPGVLDVTKDKSKSDKESWGDSAEEDEDDNDDDDDIDNAEDKDDDDAHDDTDDDNDSDDVSGDADSDSDRTESDEDENPNLNHNDDDKEEEYNDEYMRTPSNYESTDEEIITDDEYECIDEEMYKDVNVKLKDVEPADEGKADKEFTDAGHGNQESTYEQVEDDAHVTLTAIHDTQKTKVPVQTSSISFDFTTQFLNLDNVPPTDNELISMMNVDVLDQSVQLLATINSQIPAIVDAHLGTRLGDSVQKALRSYTTEFEKETQAANERYIDLIEKSVKDIIKDKVKMQLPQILPKAVSNFATPMIMSTIIESLKDVVLAKLSSQPQSTYEAAT
ncbi:hypothetical protein Tco_0961966 [Tanacetum coccineum]